MKYSLYLLLTLIVVSCTSNNEGEKYQKHRSNVINVKDDVTEINAEDVLIGARTKLYTCGDYLIIVDYKSLDKKIRLFNLHTLKYIQSFGDWGQGPTEITVVGTVAWNEADRDFYVTDHAKHQIFRYNLDSLLADSLYMPTVKTKFPNTTLPDEYKYFADTLAYGVFIQPTGTTSYKKTGGRWNMVTGETNLIDYVHPADKKKRVVFVCSPKDNLMVECNRHYDLISLYDLNGELQRNIYGPNWDKKGDWKAHFSDVAICDDKIIASYIGEDWKKHSRAHVFHVFNLAGDYLMTLDVEYDIDSFCYDETNNRIIMNLNSEYQLTYLDLDKYFKN